MKINSILVIDDSEDDRYYLKRLIDKAGFNTPLLEVSNGLEAKEFFSHNAKNKKEYGDKFPPTLVFLDINMPLMDGFEFLSEFDKIRQESQNLETVFVMMFSSSDREEDKEKALKYTFVKDYIVKGDVDKEMLYEKISNFIS